MLLLNQTYYHVPESSYNIIFVFFMIKMGEINKRLDTPSKKHGRATVPKDLSVWVYLLFLLLSTTHCPALPFLLSPLYPSLYILPPCYFLHNMGVHIRYKAVLPRYFN